MLLLFDLLNKKHNKNCFPFMFFFLSIYTYLIAWTKSKTQIMSNKDSIIINHGVSTSQIIYDLFRKNCQIIKPRYRYFPMCVQILKLEISPEFTQGLDKTGLGLTYMVDYIGYNDVPYSVLLSNEFAAELNKILVMICATDKQDILKEYLGLFPLVANDKGLYTISIDVVPGGVDEYGARSIKNKFFITCRELNETCHPARVFSCLWEFEQY